MKRRQNPEWTEQDFALAKTGEDILAHIRAAFPKTRGRPRAEMQQLVGLHFDKEFLQRFRINEALRKPGRA